MSKCSLRFFMETMGKDSLLHQAIQETCRAATIVLRGKVFRWRNEYILRIPADKAETLVFPIAIPVSIPVVVVPVGIAAIEVDEHIVDEVIHLEQLGIFVVWFAVGTATDKMHVA